MKRKIIGALLLAFMSFGTISSTYAAAWHHHHHERHHHHHHGHRY